MDTRDFPHSGLVERWLAWRAEPFLWSLPSELIGNFLSAHRFICLELVLTRQYAGESSAVITRVEGENLVVCESR